MFAELKHKKILGIGVLVVVCMVGIAGQVTHIRKRAEEFLREASALRLRVTTAKQIEELVGRYGGHVEPSTCSSRGCGYFFSFDNGWLHRLHLAPRTSFTCTLAVSDGVLDYRRVFLTSGNTSAVFGAFIDERLSSPPGIPEPFHASLQTEGSGARWRVHVDMTADATSEQHKMAYAVNLGCLSKLGGCSDAQELLPSVDWGSMPVNGAGLGYPTGSSQ
jgi:hypothetical protein